MLQFFGGGAGAQKFNSIPIPGHPTIALGSGLFGGGSAPDFQGTVVVGVNVPSGYTDDFIDLEIAGIPFFRVDSDGSIHASSSAVNHVLGNASIQHDFSIFTAATTTTGALYARGAAGQVGDVFVVRDGSNVGQFAITNIGTDIAPVWGIKTSPVANAASMVQSHVGGASTGTAIQVVDNAGFTLGWLQLVA